MPVGSVFSLTERGKAWLLRNTIDHPFAMANSAMVATVERHRARFGEGFYSRALEAIACVENGTHLAALAMCGAAIESALLVTAIAIEADEENVLRKYKQSKGREELRKIIVRSDNRLGNHIDPAFSILAYWRDNASHGEHLQVGREEALMALFTLISLVQFIDSRWTSITSPP